MNALLCMTSKLLKEKMDFSFQCQAKTADGEHKDIAHPINTETRESIKTAVLSAYEKALEERKIQKVLNNLI